MDLTIYTFDGAPGVPEEFQGTLTVPFYLNPAKLVGFWVDDEHPDLKQRVICFVTEGGDFVAPYSKGLAEEMYQIVSNGNRIYPDNGHQ